MNVPYTRPCLNKDMLNALCHTFNSGWISQGNEVKQFEQEIKAYIGCKHVVCVSSGTTALMMSYLCVDDFACIENVITTASTFIASASPAYVLGFDCDFIEPCASTGLILPNLINKKLYEMVTDPDIVADTIVIVPVHLGGYGIDINDIEHDKDKIIEDGCQSFGSAVNNKYIGSESYICCFSFHIGKIITTGEGGCICTNSDEVYDWLIKFRNHGLSEHYYVTQLGMNCKMTDLHASIGRLQLKSIDEYKSHRKQLVKEYNMNLFAMEQLDFLTCPINTTDVAYSLMPVFVHEKTDELQQYLKGWGIETRRFFPSMLNQFIFSDEYVICKSTVSYVFEEHGLLLPIGNGISMIEVQYVCKKIKEFYNA